ncbi:MAG TPA: hypothetical protein VKA54_13525 [Gemmatimonadaceae bacterium]|nr:hypothetical protein [Gemmatimonadaceae bacterium]
MRYVARVVSSLARGAVICTAAVVANTSAAGAQQAAIYGAGLQAWLGCWSGDRGADGRSDGPPSVVCIAPTADVNVANVLTVQDGRIVARETLDASGRSRPIDAARCTGVRSATWSRDGRRLFVRSTGRCAGVASATSGLLAITADGDWLDVEGISAGGGTSVRVARYREVALPTALPPDIAAVLRSQALATRSVRLAAAAPVRAEDLLEASRAVDAAVLESWILERAQRFDVAEHEVSALVNSGMPTRAADALAAIVDPQSYALARGEEGRIGAMSTTSYDSYGLPFGWGWGPGYYIPVGKLYGGGYRGPRRYGYYRPPFIMMRGIGGRPRGWDERGRGKQDDGGHSGRRGGSGGTGYGTERPGGASTPPRGDPRHATPSQPSQPSGGTIRLGKPR